MGVGDIQVGPGEVQNSEGRGQARERYQIAARQVQMYEARGNVSGPRRPSFEITARGIDADGVRGERQANKGVLRGTVEGNGGIIIPRVSLCEW